MLIRSCLQYAWPIEEPAGAPLTRAEILAHAYPLLGQVAEENDCTIMGPPAWTIADARDVPGWTFATGRVVIARIPVEHHLFFGDDDQEARYTRAEWEEIAAAEQAAQAEQAAARRQAEKAERDAFDVRVKELHSQGLNDKEIARAIEGCKDSNQVARSRARQHLAPNRRKYQSPERKPGQPPRTVDRVKELHPKGYMNIEMARIIGCASQTVDKAVRELGLMPNPRRKVQGPTVADFFAEREARRPGAAARKVAV